MTLPFQTELRDRAAAHAREWQDARDERVGLAEVEATVRRRRRGRGLLAGAGLVVAVAMVAGVAYAVLGGGSGEVAGPPGSSAVWGALADAGNESVVLSVEEELPNPGYGSTYGVVILDASGKRTTTLSSSMVTSALGSAADGWPVVTLVALDSRLDRAIFTLDNPIARVTTRVALVDLASGHVRVVDPCESPLNSVDLSQWCYSQAPTAGGVVIDPETGDAIRLPEYEACSGASTRFEDKVVATCGRVGYESYLVTLNPATGQVVDTTPLGRAPIQSPLVAAGSLYLNNFTTEGDEVLTGADGNSPQIGGASVAGMAVLGDSVLVQTESDKYGGASTYGKSLGLWSPTTGAFTKLYSLSDAEAFSVTVVPVLR